MSAIISCYQEEAALTDVKTAPCDMATVSGVDAAGLLLRFDGSSNDSQKHYKRLASYASPAAGDRVYVQKVSGTYLVLGKVV